MFVFAVGRSGSTLLARLLNSMSGLTVWGEHGGVVQRLCGVYDDLTSEPNRTMLEDQRPMAELIAQKLPLPTDGSPDALMTTEWANPFTPRSWRRHYEGFSCASSPSRFRGTGAGDSKRFDTSVENMTSYECCSLIRKSFS